MWTADLPLADEGSEKHKGVYPPASCGFYALYDGKADFFYPFIAFCLTADLKV